MQLCVDTGRQGGDSVVCIHQTEQREDGGHWIRTDVLDPLEHEHFARAKGVYKPRGCPPGGKKVDGVLFLLSDLGRFKRLSN